MRAVRQVGIAEQAAEKVVCGTKDLPAGAKAPTNLKDLTARLKPCPFKTKSKSEFFRSL